jgi:hypothetical protein
VVCAPSSDSTFPIGDTDVNCVATDATGNSSVGGFTVHVNGAAEQLKALRDAVSASTTGGVKSSLVADLNDALAGVAGNNAPKACGALTDFLGLVQAQSGRKINATSAQQFIDAATRIRAVIGCKK